ncbi:unnamed protein product [Paramecium sonneborni]|uniref:Uncharacterized protein n=1 Tax=Paramecium sonneborni TaxID=65129 RepID=A0A8S1KC19_9CILI|nr:unnamed protein product [Paramecium sonneborni]
MKKRVRIGNRYNKKIERINQILHFLKKKKIIRLFDYIIRNLVLYQRAVSFQQQKENFYTLIMKINVKKCQNK